MTEEEPWPVKAPYTDSCSTSGSNTLNFHRAPPKSTGREIWRLDLLPGTEELSPYDLLAILSAPTIESIAQAYQRWVLPRGLDEIWVAGGGSRNTWLIEGLKARLRLPLATFQELGLDEQGREAQAFAILGYLRFHGLTNVLPQTTGARSGAIAGKVTYPHNFRRANADRPKPLPQR